MFTANALNHPAAQLIFGTLCFVVGIISIAIRIRNHQTSHRSMPDGVAFWLFVTMLIGAGACFILNSFGINGYSNSRIFAAAIGVLFLWCVLAGILTGKAFGRGFNICRKREPFSYWLVLIVQAGVGVTLILIGLGLVNR